MSLYRKVSVAIWEGDLAVKLSGDAELWTVAHYLLTNRHNQYGIGLYRLPLVFIADATGFALETCLRCVRDASETGFARYDDARKTVFVVEQARHEWGDSPNPKRNDVVGLIKGLPEIFFDLRKSFLLKEFVDRYEEGWAPLFDALETHPRRVLDALGTRPAGARAQNRMQEQEQEQEQDTGVSCAAASAAGRTAPDDEDAAFWFPIKRGAGKELPPEARSNGDGKFEMAVLKPKVEEWREAFGADVEAEIQNCLQWNRDNAGKQKTPTGLHSHIGKWLARANNQGRFGTSKGRRRQVYGAQPEARQRELDEELKQRDD